MPFSLDRSWATSTQRREIISAARRSHRRAEPLLPARDLGVPLTPLETEALDLVQNLAERDENRLDLRLAPGRGSKGSHRRDGKEPHPQRPAGSPRQGRTAEAGPQGAPGLILATA